MFLPDAPIVARGLSGTFEAPQIVIASGDLGNDVRVWDLVTHEPIRMLSAGPPVFGGIRQSAEKLLTVKLDGRLVMVIGNAYQAQAWDIATGEPIGKPMDGHFLYDRDPPRRRFWAMTHTMLDGRVVLVTVGKEGLVWDLSTGERIAELLPPGPTVDMRSVACAELDGLPVAVSVRHRELLRWDLTTHKLITGPLGGRSSTGDIGCAELAGRRVALVDDWNGALREWDLATGEPLARLVGPPVGQPVSAFASTVVGGRPVTVTCEGRVRVWDIGPHEPAGRPVIGHTEHVNTVAPADIGGRAVVISGGSDRGRPDYETSVGEEQKQNTRLWDLASGEPIGSPQVWAPTGDPAEEHVSAMAYLRLDGHDVAVAGVYKSVCLWDLGAGELIAGPTPHTTDHGWLTVDYVECVQVDGHPLVVSMCNHRIRAWDARTCEPFDAPAVGGEWVHAVGCTTLNGRPIAVTSGNMKFCDEQEILQIWDIATGEPAGVLMAGGPQVDSLACAMVDGRPIAVTVDEDDRIDRWDLTTRRRIGGPMIDPSESEIYSVACTEINGRPIALAAGTDTVQPWDLHTGQPAGPALYFPDDLTVRRITTTPQGHLIVAFDADIAVLSPRTTTD